MGTYPLYILSCIFISIRKHLGNALYSAVLKLLVIEVKMNKTYLYSQDCPHFESGLALKAQTQRY